MKKYATIRNYARLHHKQAGMTLIELTVVLLILVGLAGLMIPYVSGFVEKTHDSTTLTNLSDLDRIVPQYRMIKNTYPDDLESLVEAPTATSTVGTAMYTKLFKSYLFKAEALGANALISLNKAGISSLINNNSASSDATFKSTYDVTGQIQNTKYAPLATTLVAKVSGADWMNTNAIVPSVPANDGSDPASQHLAYTFGRPATTFNTLCYDYVAFGIGQDNSMIGAALQTAPVHFSADGDSNPVDKYSRYITVFEVQKSTTTADGCPDQIQAAKFVGTAMNMNFNALIGTPSSQAWANARLK